jgi:hypothetical protein
MLDSGIPEKRRGEKDEAEDQPEERVEYSREPLREQQEERHDQPRHEQRDEPYQERHGHYLSFRASLSILNGGLAELEFCPPEANQNIEG